MNRADFIAIQDKFTQLMTEAEQFGDRCTVTLERKTLNRKITELEFKIRQTRDASLSIAEFEKLVQITEAKYTKRAATADSFKSVLALLTDSLLLRFRYPKDLKLYFAYRVRIKFCAVLKVREMQGNIKLNFKEGKLDLEIAPRGGKQTTTTKALSGGERSYSTIAFMIALWQCCDSPFYFLDEPDVFTDQVNRFVMMKILIHDALRKGDQFAFLTPQDMSSISAERDITIHRFADPVRGDMNGNRM